MKKYLFSAGALIILLIGFIWVGPKGFAVKETPSIPFQLAKVQKGDIFSRVTTTGMINPVLSVTVSTQVSGTIEKLFVDVNSVVKKGQVIARLDQDLFRAKVLQARANLENALANLAKEQAGVKMLKDQIAASIAESKASYKNLGEKYKRADELYKRKLISKDEYDTARTEWEMAGARFKESTARVDETKVKQAFLKVAAAQVKRTRAELELARVTLNRSVVRAPVSGIIILKNVEAGQTVAASLQSPPLVTIADLNQMKVDAWVDEADIGKIRVGQEVKFQVDSYPSRSFKGKVVKIYPSPQVQENVVIYDTEIHVPNADLALKPGMTANVTIVLAKKHNVLMAPITALKVRKRDLRKVYPELRRHRRSTRRSPKDRAARAQRRLLERKGRKDRIWIYKDGKPKRVHIRFGATDARYMEITEGLKEGDNVIVGIKAEAVRKQAASTSRRGSRVRTRILGGF
ncbi:MAG: efflux RND transporter periplasmic adaptor subunit [Candidatus Binatia bacterium]